MGENLTKVLGVMSGTSMDGLDLALCEFKTENSVTTFNLIASETITYEVDLKNSLDQMFRAQADQYVRLNASFGKFIGEKINEFLKKNNQTTDYIASHGHTIFHQPNFGFTSQIGCGATIAAQTGISTICDFRSLDVALNGQGAPLVPIGDRDLFHDYESCLNLGGIANISFTKNNTTTAFDICIANMALNYLAETIEKQFDEGGKMASEGICNPELLKQLLELNTKNKSIGREFFESEFLPLLNNSLIALPNKLATCIQYLVQHIVQVLEQHNLQSVLITGGGAYNAFLISQLKANYKGTIHIPTDEIIQFKEAIIFGYLGYLRIQKKINTLCSVTKASKDSIGGCVYLGSQ